MFRFHQRTGVTGAASGRPRWLGRLAAVLLVALVGTAGAGAPALAAQPGSTPEERAAAIVRPSVVYVEIEWEGWVRDKRDGQLWDSDSVHFANRCTGFAVSDDGFIVTAGHCVDPGIEGAAVTFYETIVQRYMDAGIIDESQAEAFLTDIAENSEIEGLAAGDPPIRNVFVQHGVAVSGLTAGEAFPARVVDHSPVSAGDVGLIKVDETLPTVELASGEVPVGTEILAIGYPGSADDISDATLEPSSKDGTISNLRTDGGVPVYETSAAMTGGMSGGPVVNLDGQVIGLVSRGPAEETQAFNFAAASSLITEMLAANGVTNQLGQSDVQYRAGLDAYFDGRYSDAIESFDAVLARSPAHQQAQEYRQRAVEQRETTGDVAGDETSDDGGIPGAVLAGIAAGLGLLVVGGAVLALLLVARGRRKAAPPAAPAGAAGPTTPLPFTPAPPATPSAAAPAAPPVSAPAPPASTTIANPPASTPIPTLPAGATMPAPPPAPNGPPPAPGTATPSGPAMAAPAPEGPAVATASGAGFCGNCGAALAPEGRFCTHCGAPTT